MEQISELVTQPFEEILDKAAHAARAAGHQQPMLDASQALVKEGNRALNKLRPLCQKYYDTHGELFIVALKANDELGTLRHELNDLLWEFDDYLDPANFQQEKFAEIQTLSRRAAPKIYELLNRLTFPAPAPWAGASPAPSAEMSSPRSELSSARLPSPQLDLYRSASRNISIDLRQRPQDQDPPPTPPAADPWDPERTYSHDHSVPSAPSQRRDFVPSNSPFLSAVSRPQDSAAMNVTVNTYGDAYAARSPSIIRLNSPLPPPQRPGIVIRRPTYGTENFSQPADPAQPLPSSAVSPHSGSHFPPNPGWVQSAPQPEAQSQSGQTFGASPAAFPYTPASYLAQSPTSSTGLSRSNSGPGSSLNHSWDPTTTSPYTDNISPTTLSPHHTYTQSLPNPFFLPSQLISTQIINPSLRPGQDSVTSPQAAPVSEAPEVLRPPEAPQSPEAPRALNSSNSFPDYGPIPVLAEEDAGYLPVVATDCKIGSDSSFSLLGGWCSGASDVYKGDLGMKKTKKHTFDIDYIGRCVSCSFERPMQELDWDIRMSSLGTLEANGLRYRLRFLQKSHLAFKKADEPVYGCLFCVHLGRTMKDNDATVFLTEKALFAHILRHPRPLPKLDKVVVIENGDVPASIWNNFDLHILAPPRPDGLTASRTRDIWQLPTAVARESIRHGHHVLLTHDRTPIFEFAAGSRVTGVEFVDRFFGEWCVGLHEGERGTFSIDRVRLEPPPEREIRIGQLTDIRAFSRWRFAPKDRDTTRQGYSEWLRFEKEELITNINWVYREHWCWSGKNSRGKWGIFPQSHIDQLSVREVTTPPDLVSIVSRTSHKKRHMFSLRKRTG